MSLENLLDIPAHFALVFFRLAGLMIFAPMLGSRQIPKRVKLLFCAALTAAMAGAMPANVEIPDDPLALVLGLGGEIVFGVAMGMILSLTFIAAQWAGALAGQQMGFGLAAQYSPDADFGGSPLGDLYFVFVLSLFLLMNGHHQMLLGVRNSFDALPPLSVGINADLLNLLVGLLSAATNLAVRVAAPIFVSMLVVDLALGMVGKTIPQMNLLSVGLSLRALIGLLICIVGLGAAGYAFANALAEAMNLADTVWSTPASTPG